LDVIDVKDISYISNTLNYKIFGQHKFKTFINEKKKTGILLWVATSPQQVQ